jgi:hypothetical protein
VKRSIVDRIEAEVRLRHADGIDTDPDTVHFIESTFGAVGTEALDALLSSDSDEAVELADLLFSPEESLCCRIEKHLPPEGLLRADRERLAVRLRSKPPEALARIGGSRVHVAMPPDIVDGFVDRLFLDRSVDEALAGEISKLYEEEEALQVRSRLRQARLSRTGTEKYALHRYFRTLTPDREQFWPLLEYLIGLLEAARAPFDLFAALVDRKAACLRHLRQAADRSRALQQHNIETFLMGGDRMPHVDTEALAREIVRIDDLGQILFGRPVPAPAAGLPVDLGEVSSRHDLDRLMRFFTEP